MTDETTPAGEQAPDAATQVAKVIRGLARNCEILRHNQQRLDSVVNELKKKVADLEKAMEMSNKIVVAQAIPKTLVRQ